MSKAKTIKMFGTITQIKLKSWRILNTKATMLDVAKLLSDKTKDYLIIDEIWFNRLTEVAEFYEYKPTEMESFIYSQDREIQGKLQEILEEREKKGFKTNWPKHLRNIFEEKTFNS